MAALVVPFLVMQLVNRREYQEPFPFALFAGMTLMAAAIVLLGARAARDLRVPHPRPAGIAMGVVALASALILGVGYAMLVADQWPCFLGVPNCD